MDNLTRVFEAGKDYGNDVTITILKRTPKTATIKTVFGEQRIKIKTQPNGTEIISFKCWLISALEDFDAEESKRIFLDKAYNS